jgi:hypothetical protein
MKPLSKCLPAEAEDFGAAIQAPEAQRLVK